MSWETICGQTHIWHSGEHLLGFKGERNDPCSQRGGCRRAGVRVRALRFQVCSHLKNYTKKGFSRQDLSNIINHLFYNCNGLVCSQPSSIKRKKKKNLPAPFNLLVSYFCIHIEKFPNLFRSGELISNKWAFFSSFAITFIPHWVHSGGQKPSSGWGSKSLKAKTHQHEIKPKK